MGVQLDQGRRPPTPAVPPRAATQDELAAVQHKVDQRTEALSTVQSMYRSDLMGAVAARGGRPMSQRELNDWKTKWTSQLNEALDGKGPHASEPRIAELRAGLGDFRLNPGLKTEANFGIHTARSPYRDLNPTEQKEMNGILRRYSDGLTGLAGRHGGVENIPRAELDRFKQEFTDAENKRLDRGKNPNVHVRFFSGLSGSPLIGVDWGGGLWQERKLQTAGVVQTPAPADTLRAVPVMPPPVEQPKGAIGRVTSGLEAPPASASLTPPLKHATPVTDALLRSSTLVPPARIQSEPLQLFAVLEMPLPAGKSASRDTSTDSAPEKLVRAADARSAGKAFLRAIVGRILGAE